MPTLALERSFDDAPYPGRVYAWTVVAILIVTAVLSYTDRQVLSLLVDPIRRDLGIGDTQISLLLGTAFALVYGLAGIPLGFFADRTSRRNLIFVGIVIWSLATIACGFSRNFPEIFISRLFVGLGEAVLSPAAISMISDYFPPSRRGFAVGLFLSGIAMGSGVAILVGGLVLRIVASGLLSTTFLAGEAPWRLVLLLIGLPGLAWALTILFIREPLRRAAAAGSPQAPSPLSTTTIAVWVKAAPVYIIVAAASFVDNAVGAWGPSMLIRQFQQDPGKIGIQLGLLLTLGFGGGVVVGGMLADRANARGGFRDKLWICLAAAASIALVALTMTTKVLLVVLLTQPAYFALSGVVTSVGFSAILDLVPNRTRGLAMSISFFLNVALGAGLGPTAVSLSNAYIFGLGAGLAPAIAFTAICGYAIAAAAAAYALWSVGAKIRPQPLST